MRVSRHAEGPSAFLQAPRRVWVSAYPFSRAYCPQIQYYCSRKPPKMQYLFLDFLNFVICSNFSPKICEKSLKTRKFTTFGRVFGGFDGVFGSFDGFGRPRAKEGFDKGGELSPKKSLIPSEGSPYPLLRVPSRPCREAVASHVGGGRNRAQKTVSPLTIPWLCATITL